MVFSFFHQRPLLRVIYHSNGISEILGSTTGIRFSSPASFLAFASSPAKGSKSWARIPMAVISSPTVRSVTNSRLSQSRARTRYSPIRSIFEIFLHPVSLAALQVTGSWKIFLEFPAISTCPLSNSIIFLQSWKASSLSWVTITETPS